MSDFWDDQSLRPPDNGYVKLEAIGDKVGDLDGEVITKLTKRTFDGGTDKERSCPEIEWSSGRTFTAGQVLLQQDLVVLRPKVGDGLVIELARIDKKGSRTLKRFRIVHDHGEGEPTVVDQTA